MAEGLRSLPAFQQTVPLYEKEPDDSVVCMEDKTFLWAVQWHPEFSFKTDTGFGAGFSPAGDRLQDTTPVLIYTVPVFREIFAYINGFQHRLMSNGFVPDRKLEKDRKPAVSLVLVLAGTADMDMIPSFAPVCREALKDSLRAFGDHKE